MIAENSDNGIKEIPYKEISDLEIKIIKRTIGLEDENIDIYKIELNGKSDEDYKKKELIFAYNSNDELVGIIGKEVYN